MTIRFRDFLVNYDPNQDEYLQYRAQKRRRMGGSGGPVSEDADLDEALTMAQRRKAAQRFKKYKSRIEIGKERASRRIASQEVLKKRARKAARILLMKKMIKDTPKSELDFARREQIEKRLDKMKGKIDQLAKKLLPKLRKAEMEKKRGKSQK